jgi:hypothetical protein
MAIAHAKFNIHHLCVIVVLVQVLAEPVDQICIAIVYTVVYFVFALELQLAVLNSADCRNLLFS